MHPMLADLVARGPRGTAGPPAAASPPPALIQLTSARDGRAHLVTDLDFAYGMSAGFGIYPALCGATVLVGSLASAPGPRCIACRALRDQQ